MSGQLEPEKAQEVEAQAPRPSFIHRAKGALFIGIIIASAVVTVLWIALISGVSLRLLLRP